MTDKISEFNQLTKLGYSSRAIELYQNQINVGVIEDSDADATTLGPSGELIRLYIKINNRALISDARFLCYGCPGASSAMSALTLLIKGKTFTQAKRLTPDDILEALGGLPQTKQDCAELPLKTLKKAIVEYEKRPLNKSFLFFLTN